MPMAFPCPSGRIAPRRGGTFVRATTSQGNGVGFLLIGTGTGGIVLGPHDNGELDGRAGIRKWRGSLLALGGKQDDFFDSQDARQLRRLHPGPETVVMLPGQHGVELLDDPRQARVRAAVERYLARVLN